MFYFGGVLISFILQGTLHISFFLLTAYLKMPKKSLAEKLKGDKKSLSISSSSSAAAPSSKSQEIAKVNKELLESIDKLKKKNGDLKMQMKTLENEKVKRDKLMGEKRCKNQRITKQGEKNFRSNSGNIRLQKMPSKI